MRYLVRYSKEEAGHEGLEFTTRADFLHRCELAEEQDLDGLKAVSGWTKGGLCVWLKMWLAHPHDFNCPGRFHMFGITIKADLVIILALPGVRDAVHWKMRVQRNANSCRRTPLTPKVLCSSSTSGECLIWWFICFAPIIVISTLEKLGYDQVTHTCVVPSLTHSPIQVAYMWKCMHVVVTMALHYPVKRSQLPQVMALAKQYCATKLECPYFGPATSTFANLSFMSSGLTLTLALSPSPDPGRAGLVSIFFGAAYDNCDFEIDGFFGCVKKGPAAIPGQERPWFCQWYTTVRALTLTLVAAAAGAGARLSLP